VLGIALTLERSGTSLAQVDTVDLIRRLSANARKLDRLLTDLLDLDRLSRGIVAPKRRPTDVAALVSRMAAEWTLLNGRELQLDVEPAMVSIDPGKVERIVENLLANAAKHTPPDAPVWLGVRRHGDTAIVEGGGSSFKVLLPGSPEQRPEPQRESEPAPS